MTKNEEALRVMKRYRRQVDLLEDDAMKTLGRGWIVLERDITDAMKKLDADDPLPLNYRYVRDVQPVIERLADVYIRSAQRDMETLTKQTARLGVDAADASGRKVSDGNWKKVSTAGLFTGGIFGASKDALAGIPKAVSGKIADLVTQAQGMAEQGLGWLQSQLGDVLSSAWSSVQRVIRTAAEQLFRQGQRKQREQMPIQQWRRCANHQTACLACLMLEGTFYDREEDFSDHPNGRCYIVPVEPGSEPDHAGRDWLEEQDPETQRRIMGKTRFEAWQDGELSLDQMTDVVPNAEFGPQPHIIPLKDLGLAPSKP
ncbi:MAG: hypothetical protein IJI07_01225 [Flexilinea sp.]|nr:hypothetical protein [Flexilinea sp.]